MNRHYLRHFCHTLLFAGLAAVFAVQAETVKVPVSQQGSAEVRAMLPKTGQNMSSVRQQLGEPLTVRGPFGDPPISTWTYSEFTVYFEHEHVIHAVVNPKKR